MNTLTVPYIRYGRFTSENMGGNDQYGVLDFSPDFPDEARSLLERRIVQSFQWTNGSADIYPDSFLFWRLNTDRFLFARLSDGGKDSRNRPHSVRILAVLLKNTDFERFPEDLAALANSSAWSEPSEGQLTLTPVMPENSRLTERLKSALTSGKTTCLILRHPFVQKSEEVLGINDFEESDFLQSPISRPTHCEYVIPNQSSLPKSQMKTSQGILMNRLVVIVLLILLLLSIGNNFLLWNKISDLEQNETNIASELSLNLQQLQGNSKDYVTNKTFEFYRTQLEELQSKFKGLRSENFDEKIPLWEKDLQNTSEKLQSLTSDMEMYRQALASCRNDVNELKSEQKIENIEKKNKP